MNLTGGYPFLEGNLLRQLSSYWDGFDSEIIKEGISLALPRMERLIGKLSRTNKYVWRDGEVIFTPFHSVQYAVFLYLVSNSIYRTHGGIMEADLVYYLNKVMNSCDWFYAIELPEAFYAEHPLGSVLGRAQYGTRFFVYQGTTVGGNRDRTGNLSYPVIGNNVLMYADSSILGKSKIGDNVILSAGTRVLNEDVPDNSIVFGCSPNLTIRVREKSEILERERLIWENLE